ncbi:MAG: sel1 repeat family protein [Alphaproteobacteria bacterium]|nr:sel1 repeat family protein [Alphaproteobacteria bacterium]
MTDKQQRYSGLSRFWLGLFCALFTLSNGSAMAGWKEANAALETGKLSAAMSHIQPLAEQGDASAQYMLGYLLSGAKGIEPNLSEAFKWYTIAYAQGQTNAATARAMIGKKLGPFKAAEAQRQAVEWLQDHNITVASSKAQLPRAKAAKK